MLRSEALNQKYHLGTSTSVTQGMTPAEHRALVIRSEALNKQYGLGKWSKSATARATTSTSGFSWGAFGIGAVAMLGLVLVGIGVVAGNRQRPQRPSRSHLVAALAGNHRLRLPSLAGGDGDLGGTPGSPVCPSLQAAP